MCQLPSQIKYVSLIKRYIFLNCACGQSHKLNDCTPIVGSSWRSSLDLSCVKPTPTAEDKHTYLVCPDWISNIGTWIGWLISFCRRWNMSFFTAGGDNRHWAFIFYKLTVWLSHSSPHFTVFVEKWRLVSPFFWRLDRKS